MLTNLVSKNKYLVRMIIMVLIGLILLFGFITMIGGYSKDSAANAGATFSFVILAVLLGLLLYCILTNRHDYAGALGFIYLAYYVITALLSSANPLYYFTDGNHGTYIAGATFALIANIAFTAFVVLGLITYLKGKRFGNIPDILAFVFLGGKFLAMIMLLSAYGVFKADWTSSMNAVVAGLFEPLLVVLGYYYMILGDEEIVEDIEDEPLEDVVEDKTAKKTKK